MKLRVLDYVAYSSASMNAGQTIPTRQRQPSCFCFWKNDAIEKGQKMCPIGHPIAFVQELLPH
jgi:hypothetical protein